MHKELLTFVLSFGIISCAKPRIHLRVKLICKLLLELSVKL